VVLVIRTRGPFYRSKPAKALVFITLGVDATALALPYSPLAGILGFNPIPLLFVVLLGLILGLYMACAELAKHFFYK
jgi:Mg2+-importing ATPase